MKRFLIATLAVSIIVLVAGYVCAADTEDITATAVVAPVNPTFSINIFKSLSANTYDWDNPIPPSSGMDFETLTNAVPDDPTSALAASHHFLVLVGVLTNSGDQYQVKYTGEPLVKVGDPTVSLSGDAWTVAADVHYDPDTVYPAGIDYDLYSAEDTYYPYTSNSSGDSDTFRMYFGITGDPDQAAGPNLIPPTQEAGTYEGTVQLDVYAL